MALAASIVSVTALAPGAEAAPAATPGTFTITSTPVALNQPSDPEMGVLAPAADATTRGMYGTQTPMPVIPIHVALARNGNLVAYGTPQGTAQQGGLAYDNWNLSLGSGTSAHTVSASMHGYNSFCNSLVGTGDGRLLMVGGNSTMSTMSYDPRSYSQTMGQNLNLQRWYATTLRLPDDCILVLGGADYYNTGAYQRPNDNNGVATTPEIGTGTGAWMTLPGANSAVAFGAADNRWWYPRAFNGPRGLVVGTSGDQVWTLDTAGTGTVRKVGTLPFNPRVSGSQVMYAPGRVLVAGGGQPFNEDGTTATNAAAIIDFSRATPSISTTGAMANPRNWLNLTVLPNGEVFANGGTRVGTQGGDANSVRQAEIWNPANGTWRAAATAQRTRTYHSTSMLLPGGAVFTGGGGVPGPEDNLNAELYYPAYLFTKNAAGATVWASRPAITSIAGSAAYGGQLSLTIEDGRTIASASLISAPTVTHSVNTDQRRIPLTISQRGGTVTATLPTSVNTMPPGDYMLTVVDSKGVPSASQILTINRSGAGSVTVGAAEQVKGAGTATPTTPTTPATPTGSVPLTPDTAVGLEAVNFAAHRVVQQDGLAYLRAVDGGSDVAAQSASSWVVRAGLAAAEGVSLESTVSPGYFLAVPADNAAGAVALVKNDGSAAFATRATFAAAVGNTGQNTTLQAWGDRTLVLRHQNFQLFAQRIDGSDLARADSTFSVRPAFAAAPPALTAGRSVGLEASNFAGYRVQHENFQTYLRQVGPTSADVPKAGTSWVVRTGLASGDGVSFESLDWPGWFLAAPDAGTEGAVAMVQNDGSAGFATRATFAAVASTSGSGTVLQTWGDRGIVLRHQDFQLFAQRIDGSALAVADSTFLVRTGLAPVR